MALPVLCKDQSTVSKTYKSVFNDVLFTANSDPQEHFRSSGEANVSQILNKDILILVI